ncbi:hypothetical protein IWQ60_000511 [Tieghemiomyces parasiticus]|uniref:Uncharacterized protein n=1 Tax=Tieghemiomyces parasiticus TaxID=78921 RepID=A0A9W8AEM9_9FUNG|nr:hypothetical protein IWQ60_000511 [Tieghemiomyces parasiticus]
MSATSSTKKSAAPAASLSSKLLAMRFMQREKEQSISQEIEQQEKKLQSEAQWRVAAAGDAKTTTLVGYVVVDTVQSPITNASLQNRLPALSVCRRSTSTPQVTYESNYLLLTQGLGGKKRSLIKGTKAVEKPKAVIDADLPTRSGPKRYTTPGEKLDRLRKKPDGEPSNTGKAKRTKH